MPDTSPTPRRRWFRFGLRTMFVVLTVMSLIAPLAWKRFGYTQDEATNYYVGSRPEQIVGRLGAPTYDVVESGWDRGEMRQVRVLVYERWNGSLLVNFWDQGGQRWDQGGSESALRHIPGESRMACRQCSVSVRQRYSESWAWALPYVSLKGITANSHARQPVHGGRGRGSRVGLGEVV